MNQDIIKSKQQSANAVQITEALNPFSLLFNGYTNCIEEFSHVTIQMGNFLHYGHFAYFKCSQFPTLVHFSHPTIQCISLN